MMTSSGEDNWPWEFGSPFLSSFRHISPSGGFCQVSELTVYTKKMAAFGDGRQDICKDKASNLGPAAG